jgi:hypothetical protein
MWKIMCIYLRDGVGGRGMYGIEHTAYTQEINYMFRRSSTRAKATSNNNKQGGRFIGKEGGVDEYSINAPMYIPIAVTRAKLLSSIPERQKMIYGVAFLEHVREHATHGREEAEKGDGMR